MQPSREEEIHCPSCRRYVSTLERCPYCGARVPKRTVFRLLKWGGLALAVCGVLALYADATVFKAMIKDPPLITLAEIEPTMNFAVVRVEGLVTGVAYRESDMTIGMWLSQGEQTIFVKVYDEETKRLIATQNIPRVGDNASIIGQLRVRPDFRMIILQVAGGLHWSRPDATPMSIDNVLADAENILHKRVQIEGRYLGENVIIGGWARKIILHDLVSDNKISVLMPYTVLANFQSPFRVIGEEKFQELGLRAGQILRVRGAVGMYAVERGGVYYEEVQIQPAKPELGEDIEVIG